MTLLPLVLLKSILIIKPSSLGDIVHTLPAVAAIRDANPNAQITWVINPEWAPLLRGNRDVNHVHIFPRGEFRGPTAAFNLLRWRKETRRLRPDVALDFQGLLRSAFIARSSCAREILGMSDAREGSRFFYDKVAPVDRRAHAVERYLKLAETFGAPIPAELRFPLPTGDAMPRFGEDSPFILLHPYARGRRKSLSNAVITEFCRIFAPMRVVLVGQTHRKFSAARQLPESRESDYAAATDSPHPHRGVHNQCRQRSDAHCRGDLRSTHLHSHLERSASRWSLQSECMGVEKRRATTRA